MAPHVSVSPSVYVSPSVSVSVALTLSACECVTVLGPKMHISEPDDVMESESVAGIRIRALIICILYLPELA